MSCLLTGTFSISYRLRLVLLCIALMNLSVALNFAATLQSCDLASFEAAVRVGGEIVFGCDADLELNSGNRGQIKVFDNARIKRNPLVARASNRHAKSDLHCASSIKSALIVK